MRFHALQITQPSGRVVYSFAATADMLLRLTDVPHIGRGDAGNLVGYQRPEVSSHIAEIRRYLESEGAVLSNTIVVALNESVEFTPLEPLAASDSPARYGTLEIPEPEKGEPYPGFVVDGQQRLAAIASCKHEEFPFFITAMIAPDVSEQRKQFVLVNRTKPLPQGMIYELLPSIDGTLPASLARQQVAAQITNHLNLLEGSSLHNRIKTPTCPEGVIKDNSIRRTVLNSLNDGALYHLQRTHRNDPALQDKAITVVDVFWKGVSEAFHEAWNLPPKKSRLTHGAGIVALGYVMDEIYLRLPEGAEWTPEYVRQELEILAPHCAWTSGAWSFENEERPWNGLQNTDKDIRMLTAFFRRHLQASSDKLPL